MKNKLRLLLLALAGVACQSNESTIFGVEPQLNTYSDEAPASQKLFCNSVNCENPGNQEIYTYSPAGQLIRMEQYARMASAKLEKVSYTDYQYSPTGQLSSKIHYSRYGNDTRWVAYDESEYIYSDGVLSQERTYYNQHNPEQRLLTGQIEYTYQDGKKVAQAWFDANHILTRRVVNEYSHTTLIRETWYGANSTELRRFEHRFAGNRRQISEFMPNTNEPLSLVEKAYDSQGRLTSEETKVNNPLLCSMQAGVIRYIY